MNSRTHPQLRSWLTPAIACLAALILLPQASLAEKKKTQAELETEPTPERSVEIEPKPWDQEHMTELTQKLSGTGWRRTGQHQPN